MLATKIIAAAIVIAASASTFADTACENNSKTRDDFLACTNTDTNRDLARAKALYESIRPSAKGDKQAALDQNYSLWQSRLKSDCDVFAKAFNDWKDVYSPDTDFQISECRSKIAKQELEFYSWLKCPDDMETSDKPKCAALKKVLGGSGEKDEG